MSYRFTPAACNSLDKRGLGLYIKYHKVKHDKIIVKQDTYNYMWLDCPDRELLLVKNRDLFFHPVGENFDEYVDLNLFDDAVANAIDLDIYMINFTAYNGNRESSPLGRRSGRNPNLKKQPHVLADSGGFQLYSGVKEFINPLDVVNWYNENVDWGMVLDVPPIVQTPEYIKKAAEIQAKNVEIMLKHKKKDLELINIIQGQTFEQRRDFLDIVDTPKIDRLAFSGYRGNTVSSIADIYRTVSLPRRFKHYHILGVYNLPRLAAIVKIANMEQNKDILITSDASTPIQSSVNKMYHHQQTIFEPPKRCVIGHKSSIFSTRTLMPCSCPVCSSIKYMNILGFLDNQIIGHLLSLHNIYEINRYTLMMDELARTVDDKEYRTVIKHQLKSRGTETLQALDLIKSYEADPKKAMKKYSLFFSNKGGSGLFSGSLFHTEDVRGDDNDEELSSTTIDKNLFAQANKSAETDKQKLERQLRVIKNYTNFHKGKPVTDTALAKVKTKVAKEPSVEEIEEPKIKNKDLKDKLKKIKDKKKLKKKK